MTPNEELDRLYEDVRTAPTRRAKARAVVVALRAIWTLPARHEETRWVHIPFRRFPIGLGWLITGILGISYTAGFGIAYAVTGKGFWNATPATAVIYTVISVGGAVILAIAAALYNAKRRREWEAARDAYRKPTS